MLRCPVCMSTDVFLVAGGYTGMIYRCKQCGYQGAFVVECEKRDGDAEKGKRE
jgi:transposase-like protein